VWPAFDADKVEELKVTGRTGRYAQEEGQGWTAVDKKDTKVKANVVEQTLDILARLEAHHYVADVKGDLKEYGLEKPAWKIEVQAPTGKRELWIGAMEDKSKRPYATIAGSGTVFVLDEVDKHYPGTAAVLLRRR